MGYVPEKYHHQSLTNPKIESPTSLAHTNEVPGQTELSLHVRPSLDMMYANDLKRQIERILGWEPAKYWRPKDYTQLSNRILAYTYQHVSAIDLQRFWHDSIIDSSRIPLLNTLARFADFHDWDDFRSRQTYGVFEAEVGVDLIYPRVWEIPSRWTLILCYLSVVTSVLIAVLLIWFR